MLIDRFGRKVDSFRIAITSRCNYQCIFCHREGMGYSQRNEVLDASDYGFLARVSVKLGIKSFKLTGGEPLIREDVIDIVREMTQYTSDVSITTNGSLLVEKAKGLADAGLRRLNVSLHSLNPSIYSYITGGSTLLEKVIKGIDEAVNHGIRVKVDFVVLRVNIGEVESILEFASERGLDVNIIELIPLGAPEEVYKEQHASLDPIINYLEKTATGKTVREFQNRPVYIMPSGIRVEVIKGYGNPLLCSRCTRLRLTPEGFIKTCLFLEKPLIDISVKLKKRDEDGVIEGIRRAVYLREPFFKPG